MLRGGGGALIGDHAAAGTGVAGERPAPEWPDDAAVVPGGAVDEPAPGTHPTCTHPTATCAPVRRVALGSAAGFRPSGSRRPDDNDNDSGSDGPSPRPGVPSPPGPHPTPPHDDGPGAADHGPSRSVPEPFAPSACSPLRSRSR